MAADDTSAEARKPGERPRILVVDDEPDVLEVIKSLLEEASFEVSAHESAVEALQRVKVRRFDALVLDLYMPQMSGLLFHAKLKVLNPKLAGRTLFVSGYVSKEEVRQYLTTNAHFLQKPFNAHELINIVTELSSNG
jgi:CheY-like chemotaxis protein